MGNNRAAQQQHEDDEPQFDTRPTAEDVQGFLEDLFRAGLTPEQAREYAYIGKQSLSHDEHPGALVVLMPSGMVLRGAAARAKLAREIAGQVNRESYGPDPEQALVTMLQQLGPPADEAAERASGRAWREDNGAVAGRLSRGGSAFVVGENMLRHIASNILSEARRDGAAPADLAAAKRASSPYNP